MGFLIKHSVLANLYFLSFGTKEMLSCFVFKNLKLYQLASILNVALLVCVVILNELQKEKKKENAKKKKKRQGVERSDHSKGPRAPMGAFHSYLEKGECRGHSTLNLFSFFS